MPSVRENSLDKIESQKGSGMNLLNNFVEAVEHDTDGREDVGGTQAISV